MIFEVLTHFATLAVRQAQFPDPGLYIVQEIGSEGLYFVTKESIVKLSDTWSVIARSTLGPADSGGLNFKLLRVPNTET